MGWYTTGPGKFTYKYGNVLAAARASKLGVLTMVPRLVCVDEHDDIFEDFEFLGPLQKRILENKRPWKALPFDLEVDDSGESILLPDRDAAKMLRRIRKVVVAHRASIFAEIRQSEPGAQVVRMGLGAEVHWDVERDEWEALVAWLNERLAGAPISLAGLREGQLDEYGDYQPPKSLDKAFAKIESDKAARHLAATALGYTLVTDEALCLYQPEDDSEETIWEAGEGG